jgi:CO/xanthine dehydrogenase Mo-binding subunit
MSLKIEAPQAARILGTSPRSAADAEKITGRAVYGIDIHPAGMLYGAVLRSPHAHARIRSIDVRAALAMPGVRAVATAADLPDLEDKIAQLGETAVNRRYQSYNILASDKALYHGHAIAAVAAVTLQQAEAAVEQIQVEYEVLPAVTDVEAAMRPGAPILLEELRTDELGTKGEAPTNIASHFQYQRGDLAAGFAAADVVVEREFRTAAVHQGYIEPQNATAAWRPNGRLTIWTSTQGSFGVRDQVAEILEVPASQVRVVPTEVGGAFGGKNGVYLEPVAALLSRKCGGKPVRLVMSNRDVLCATGPTSPGYMKVKMGADREGRLTAAQVTIAYAAGAFPGSPVGSGATTMLSPYKVDNLLVDGYDVVANRPRAAAYRAPGGTNAAFAVEVVVDELAEALGLDPIEFRLRNAVQEGDRRPDGPVFGRIGLRECLEAARAHPHYSAPLPGRLRGRGVAAGAWGNGGGQSSAAALLNSDGTITLSMGSVDLTGTRVSLSMQFAEALGIPLEDVVPAVADTDSVSYTDGTWGSRTTFSSGLAVITLAGELTGLLKARAAELWGVPAEEIGYTEGILSHGEWRLTIRELAGKIRQPVMASATARGRGVGPAFAVHIADVEVDPETGKVQILRYTAVQDVGRAIHPDFIQGQMRGGTVQGIGWALSEEYVYDEQGRLLNPSFLDYRLPTALDVPRIDTVIVEAPNPGHPYGVRGVGEVPIVPPPGALANAIYHAIGVRLQTLPMSPPRVLEAIWEKEKEA